MHSFPMNAAKHFYDNPLSIYLDPKIFLIYRPHPVVIWWMPEVFCVLHRVHIFTQCICPLSWSVHCNFTGDGKCNARGWACTPHLHQPGLILLSWLNVRQKAAVTTLCTQWCIVQGGEEEGAGGRTGPCPGHAPAPFPPPHPEVGSLLHLQNRSLCCGSGIRCLFDPESGMKNNQSPYFKCLWGPGIDSKKWIPPAYSSSVPSPHRLFKNSSSGLYFRELRNNYFGVKILKFFDADPGWKKFGSGIRDGKT